jgi:hypothetical protein
MEDSKVLNSSFEITKSLKFKDHSSILFVNRRTTYI